MYEFLEENTVEDQNMDGQLKTNAQFKIQYHLVKNLCLTAITSLFKVQKHLNNLC